jgi:hypothetical protein
LLIAALPAFECQLRGMMRSEADRVERRDARGAERR